MWSARTVGAKTFLDAEGVASKLWIARSLLARRFRLPLLAPRRWRAVRFRRLTAPVCLDPALGGMSAYYEIVHAGVYGAGPPTGGVVVDVGANVGVFSAWCATHTGASGTVLAMEPHPLTFQMTQRTIQGLPGRAIAIQCAAGAQPGLLTLSVTPGKTVEATLETRVGGDQFDVAVSTIDIELARHGITHVDLLKIDVEGWEVEALDGAVGALAHSARAAVETTATLRTMVEERLQQGGFELLEPYEGVWGDDSLCIIRAAKRRE